MEREARRRHVEGVRRVVAGPEARERLAKVAARFPVTEQEAEEEPRRAPAKQRVPVEPSDPWRGGGVHKRLG